MGVSLYDVLKTGYNSNVLFGYDKIKQKQKKDLLKQGYEMDDTLSSRHQQVYYDKINHKMLFNVNGTNPYDPRDLITDVYLGLGKIKNTSRYKEAETVLNEARQKYNPTNSTLVGHSLGGSIASYLGSKGRNDKVITLDKGATIGQKTRSLEQAVRTSGDAVSLLNSNSTHMTTLLNPSRKTGNFLVDTLAAHDVSNVKNEKIFI
jgi:hypothetical protein